MTGETPSRERADPGPLEPAPVHDSGLAPLSDRSWLRLAGADAVGFLHGQVSADIKELAAGRMQPAAYCSPKGRVLAVLRVSLDPSGGLLAELPSSLADATLRRLRMFVLRADVQLEADDDIAAFGLWGDKAGELLAAEGWRLPRADFELATTDDLSLLRLPAPAPRFQVFGSGTRVRQQFGRLSDALPPRSPAEWRLLDIEAGLADVQTATADRHLPQSLGLERWQIINYRKGCYPGQEVVARLHYRGRLKRRLYRGTCELSPPEPATPVVDANGNGLGEIIMAAPLDERRSRVLAVLKESSVRSECRLVDTHGAALGALEPADGNP